MDQSHVDEKYRVASFGEYMSKAITTRVYPQDLKLPYTVLGLVGEAGELHAKVVQYSAISTQPVLVDQSKAIAMAHELGDIQWYIADICDHYEIVFDGEVDHPVFLTLDSLEDYSSRLLLHASKVAERAKKIIRDRNSIPDKIDIAVFQEQLSAMVAVSKLFCSRLGIYYRNVLSMNLDKLDDRADREVLHGEGDER